MKLSIRWTDDRTSTAYVADDELADAVARIVQTPGVLSVTTLDDSLDVADALMSDDMIGLSRMRPAWFN